MNKKLFLEKSIYKELTENQNLQNINEEFDNILKDFLKNFGIPHKKCMVYTYKNGKGENYLCVNVGFVKANIKK